MNPNIVALLEALTVDPDDGLAYDAIADLLEEEGRTLESKFIRSLGLHESYTDGPIVGVSGGRVIHGKGEKRYQLWFEEFRASLEEHEFIGEKVRRCPAYLFTPYKTKKVAVTMLARLVAYFLGYETKPSNIASLQEVQQDGGI